MGQNTPFYWQSFALQVGGVVLTFLLGAISQNPEKTGLDALWSFWLAVVLGAGILAIQKGLALLPSAEQKVEIQSLKEDKKRLISQLPEEAARPPRVAKMRGGARGGAVVAPVEGENPP